MKNYKLPLFLLAIILSLSSVSQPDVAQKSGDSRPALKPTEIVFIENSLSNALRKAATDRKYIFVDAYTTWCGPCKQLKNSTFKDHETADFFNSTFVNLSVDMEKGDGVKLAEKWGVQEYPTLLILDHKGNVLLRSIGYVNGQQLTAFGKKALEQLN